MIKSLFCPSCSTPNSVGQSFCRSCGLNLEKTAMSLSEQRSENAQLERRNQSEKLERFGNFAFTGFGIVLAAGVIGLLYAIATKMILNGTQPLVGIFLSLFVIFAAMLLGYVFRRESLADSENGIGKSRESTESIYREPINLPGDRPFEPASSVVDETTRRLRITNDLSAKKHRSRGNFVRAAGGDSD